ncbi:ras-related and estrogen-regulated growth inhibitor-like [Actinia tenebrosa]|uniref:small monomeric GTPase n=1 Tax=Actinia tenebrosa TaxID=6105 RepID=A0A6P8JCL2_ACTTE|nr:ras-related and estrogen-regulated growth inhibitor-like [Actinia tenebrosa]XP_031575341.1 ras-related and estrogen-regulated growth inhibitor-like [Actinia tenebrosa]XP_031575342.1 ras-related and estrogen-regulated growth inhibitor-like [Actinia tenebrosa]XP_031575343.1 ras-related and estrogen-regulated growth inhibitor-like [Actinia tenebrosa]XP_031575344.1 ras-related and estrogen-regulated growth inhibitor-like [Actinia tenebrosa]
MRRRKNSQQPNLKCVRVMVMGKDGVGKTALIVRYLTRRYIHEYDKTLESTYRHHLQIENEFIYLDLMDTAGENNQSKLERCLSNGDMFLLLYSIVDHASFDEVARIARYIKDHKYQEARLLILIGNKRDLGHIRKVDETEGSALAQELDCPFYEISVSECDGYKEVSDMVYMCLKKYLQNDKQDMTKARVASSTSSLIKMKDGWMRKAGAMRRKSVTTL